MTPLGRRVGHIDLLCFPVTQMCVGIYLRHLLTFCHYSPIFKVTRGYYVSKFTCLHNISYIFSLMAFKFLDIVTMDKMLYLLTFRDYSSIFKVTGGNYVSKFTLFTQYLLRFFTNGFKILRYGDHGQDLDLNNLS